MVYTALLAFLSVFIFFKIQERDLIIQLNNHNLSQDAYQIKFRDKLTIAAFENKLSNSSKLTNLQVHFQVRNKKITYFWGKGDYAVPPILKGSFFSTKDLKSDLPVAVVGKDWQKKLYKPKDQSYLHYEGHYYPVLGVMGDKFSSSLDQQIFMIPSLQQREKMLVSHFRVIVDGKRNLKAKTLTTILGNVQVKRLHTKQIFISQKTWIASHGIELFGLVLVMISFILAAVFWHFFAVHRYRQARFLQKGLSVFIFEEWENFALLAGLGLIFGSWFGLVLFKSNSYLGLLIYELFGFLLSNIYLIFSLKKSLTKEDHS